MSGIGRSDGRLVDPRPVPQRYEIALSVELALHIIADAGCERSSTSGLGSCIVGGYGIVARYGAFKACHPCIAWAALTFQLERPGERRPM